jgi:hypothetical protein
VRGGETQQREEKQRQEEVNGERKCKRKWEIRKEAKGGINE